MLRTPGGSGPSPRMKEVREGEKRVNEVSPCTLSGVGGGGGRERSTNCWLCISPGKQHSSIKLHGSGIPGSGR